MNTPKINTWVNVKGGARERFLDITDNVAVIERHERRNMVTFIAATLNVDGTYNAVKAFSTMSNLPKARQAAADAALELLP